MLVFFMIFSTFRQLSFTGILVKRVKTKTLVFIG
jgi:hypothetical protein